MGHVENNVRIKNIKSNGKSFVAYRWSVRNQHLWESLNRLGCTPQKSLTLAFPKNELFENKNLIIPFIRGYFDGDGCISFNNNKTCSAVVSIVGTKSFLEDIAKNLNITKYRMEQKSNAFQIRFNVKDSFNFIKTVYNNASIYLDRKFNRANLFLNNNNAVQRSDLLDY
jgi:hypothetical protein